jgi:hypothetical protein
VGPGSGTSFIWLIVTIDESRKFKSDGIVFSLERDVSGNGRYSFQSLPLGYTPMLWYSAYFKHLIVASVFFRAHCCIWVAVMVLVPSFRSSQGL